MTSKVDTLSIYTPKTRLDQQCIYMPRLIGEESVLTCPPSLFTAYIVTPPPVTRTPKIAGGGWDSRDDSPGTAGTNHPRSQPGHRRRDRAALGPAAGSRISGTGYRLHNFMARDGQVSVSVIYGTVPVMLVDDQLPPKPARFDLAGRPLTGCSTIRSDMSLHLQIDFPIRALANLRTRISSSGVTTPFFAALRIRQGPILRFVSSSSAFPPL